MSDTNFWKRKLAAYLHDPPSKALNLAIHLAGFDTGINSVQPFES